MSKRFYSVMVLIACSAFASFIHAERWLSVTVPVKQALTEAAFPSDHYLPQFDICSAVDSTVVAKSKTIFNETDVIGGLSTEDENGKFLIHVYVEKFDAVGNPVPSADFEDAWLELDLSKIQGKRYRTDEVLIPVRRVKSSNDKTAR